VFFGEFEYKLDEKGRVPLPPRFRERLKGGIVLAKGFENCITVYPLTEWQKLSEKISSSRISPNNLRKLKRAVFGSAYYIGLDGQGRVSLPASLREHAGMGDEVVVVGVDASLELWGKEQWLKEKSQSQEQAWQIIEGLDR
jgi:MraZ protein